MTYKPLDLDEYEATIRAGRITTISANSLLTDAREARKVIAALVEALSASRTMRERGPQPTKLDAALTWKENDALADDMAFNALALAAPWIEKGE